jgi:hypothetical protein
MKNQQLFDSNTNLIFDPRQGLTPRQVGLLTVFRNVLLSLTLTELSQNRESLQAVS